MRRVALSRWSADLGNNSKNGNHGQNGIILVPVIRIIALIIVRIVSRIMIVDRN